MVGTDYELSNQQCHPGLRVTAPYQLAIHQEVQGLVIAEYKLQQP